MPGCGSQRLLRCRLHPAGRGPNSSSLFPPLAAVVAVAPKGRGFAPCFLIYTSISSPSSSEYIPLYVTRRGAKRFSMALA